MIKRFTPLNNIDFRQLFLARCVSLFGSGVSTIALAFLAYHLATQGGTSNLRAASIIIATALTIKMLVYIVMSPILAHLSPRLPRKTFLISMDLARCLLITAVAFTKTPLEIYILIGLISVFSAGFTPIYQSIVPEIIEGEQSYSKALVLNRLASNSEALFSPVIAAALLLIFNFHALFFLDALTFLISAFYIAKTNIAQHSATAIKKAAPHVLSGIQAYCSNKYLLGCLCLVIIGSIAGATMIVNSVVFFHGIFQQSKSVTSLAMASFGVGAALFAFLMPRLREKFSEEKLMLFGALLIIATCLFSLNITHWIYLIITWFFLGIGNVAIETLLSIIVNRFASKETRTSLFAANFSLTHACWLIAYLFTGYMGAETHISHYFSIMLIACLILLILARLFFQLAPKHG